MCQYRRIHFTNSLYEFLEPLFEKANLYGYIGGSGDEEIEIKSDPVSDTKFLLKLHVHESANAVNLSNIVILPELGLPKGLSYKIISIILAECNKLKLDFLITEVTDLKWTLKLLFKGAKWKTAGKTLYIDPKKWQEE